MVGVLASAAGRGVAFGLVTVVVAAMALVCRRIPDAGTVVPGAHGALVRALGDRRVLATMWLVALPALISGSLSLLGSLRLRHLGAGAGAIGLTFLTAALAQAVVGPLSGNVSDRHGRLLPIGVGLGVIVVLLAVFGLPDGALAMAALVVAIGTVIEVFWAPAMAWLSETLERRGDAAALAGALINLAWSGGQIAGSAGGGGLAGATADWVPMLVIAGIALVTLGVLLCARPVNRRR